MAINLQHFCTKTGEVQIVDGQPVEEKIEYCLANYFAPDATYKIGAVYQGVTTEADLKKFASIGLTLQFAADDRFYFMDEQLRDKIFDQPHFGVAYGSNMFTPCKSFAERENLRVLVVDAATGENGGVMPPSEAIKLVGDGDGKIDAKLHESLGSAPNTPFQTRFGIKSRQVGLNPDETIPKNETWQLGKGTFTPRDLSKVGNGYDLVISTDQLKGRKNVENTFGILGADKKPIKVGNEIKPGEYTMTMGIGNKTDAYYGLSSTGAQFWNNFPSGVKYDVLPRLERRLEELKEMACDPRKIAADYIRMVEERKKYSREEDELFEDEEVEQLADIEQIDAEALDAFVEQALGSTDQELMYRLLKADIDSGHFQILEMPKIIDKLKQYWREQYMDCATGRFIKFDSAMAQTCHDLAPNEVNIPSYPDGAEVIVYRGPTANSNTIDVYINKHLVDEPHDIGVIKMSPKGLKHSLSDCDGDRISYALASEFPVTAAEIKEKQKDTNRYAEIVKLDKKAYEGSFEEIALKAMENRIGVIANLCMKGIALENECQFVPEAETFKLMVNISVAANKMLAAEKKENQPAVYPVEIKQQIEELADWYKQALKQKINLENYQSLEEYNNSLIKNQVALPQLSSDDVEKSLHKAQHFYHDVVGILGGQLQIEVDRGKSANRSDAQLVNAFSAIIKGFDVAPWVEERKIEQVYMSRNMQTKGHGAIDMMVRLTNQAFEENALVARSTQQFQDLFKDVNFTQDQQNKAAQLKREYETLLNRAIEIKREVKEASGPRIIATSSRGNSLEIIGLDKFKHPNAFDTHRGLDIRIFKNDELKTKETNKWIALAPVFDENNQPKYTKTGEKKYQSLGYISSETAARYAQFMKHLKEINDLTIEVLPGLTQSQVKAAFKQAKEFATNARDSIPDNEKEQVAAAMWSLSTSGKDENATRKASAVFAIFGLEIAARLNQLQFTEFTVVGVHKPTSEHQGRRWHGEKVNCEIVQEPDPSDPVHNRRWLVADGKRLAVFRSESAQLPIGTKFEASITTPVGASVTITTPKGNQIKVGQLKKYSFAQKDWQGEKAIVSINVTGKNAIALVNDQPLGVIDKESVTFLNQKLAETGKKLHGIKFAATLESSPSTIAHIKLEPQTILYPEMWTKEEPIVRPKELSLVDALKPLLKEKYKEKTQALMHDDKAGLKAYLIPGEEFEQYMQEKGQPTELMATLAQEIDSKFGAQSFIGEAYTKTQKELYFGILIPTSPSQERTVNRLMSAFKFPHEYDQMQRGQRTRLIAIGLEDMQSLLTIAHNLVQQSKEQVEQITKAQASIQLTTKDTISNQELVQPKEQRKFVVEEPKEQKAIAQALTAAKDYTVSQQSTPVREEWEKIMLKLALDSLKPTNENANLNLLTSSFLDGKYKAIFYKSSATLWIEDNSAEGRGILYQVEKGQPATHCQFTQAEKEAFTQIAIFNKYKLKELELE